jgi:hypothetical protein
MSALGTAFQQRNCVTLAFQGSPSASALASGAACCKSCPATLLPLSCVEIMSCCRYTDPEDPLEQQQIQQLLEDVEAVELVCDSLFRCPAHSVQEICAIFNFCDYSNVLYIPICFTYFI